MKRSPFPLVLRDLASRSYHYGAYQVDRTVSGRVSPQETLLISGFWRSGTTWLQQSLARLINAKTVFEPLDPLVPEVPPLFARLQASSQKNEFLRLYMPYSPADRLDDVLQEHFARALVGDMRGRWVRHVRTGLREALKRRIVMKVVRGQLCLRAVQNSFGPPVIHVYRDPRAVAASVKMTLWHQMFDSLYLTEQLLEQPDGRADFFERWRDEIRECDQLDKLARVAAYWALAERYVQATYEDQPANAVLISYAQLVRQPESVPNILDRLNIAHQAQSQLAVMQDDSRSTVAQRKGISSDERIFGWQKKLTAAEIKRIEELMALFDLNDRLVNV